MKKISVVLLLLLLLTSCSGSVDQDCTNCFNLDDYSITADIEITNLHHSSVEAVISINNPNDILESVYVTVRDSDGGLLYMIYLADKIIAETINETIDINYLIQDESYTISVKGKLTEDDDILITEIASTTIQTGIWGVEHPRVGLYGLDKDFDSVTFSVYVDFNDLRGKRVEFKIYENDTLIDTISSDWLLSNEMYTVAKTHHLSALVFQNLKPDTQYIIFASVLHLNYDYDNNVYEYNAPRKYLTTFRTDKIE